MDYTQFVESHPLVQALENTIKSNGWYAEISRAFTRTPEYKQFKKQFKQSIVDLTEIVSKQYNIENTKELRLDIQSIVSDYLDELWGS